MLQIIFSLMAMAVISPLPLYASFDKEEVSDDTRTKIEFTPQTFDEILDAAGASGKLIFFDAYAVWCGPCKMMDSNVFTLPEVAALYNTNFINAKFDMEKGEGLLLRERYNITAYPTYLFLNAEGDVIHKRLGSCSAEDFIQFGLDAMSPYRNLSALEKHYDEHLSDPVYTYTYLSALQQAGMDSKMSDIAAAWLENQDEETLMSAFNYQILNEYLMDPLSPAFSYLIKNREAFGQRYGTEAVEKKIYSTLLFHTNTFFDHRSPNPHASFRTEAFNDYMQFIEQSGFYRANEISGLSRLNMLMFLKDFKAYATVVDEMIARNDLQHHPNPTSQYVAFANNMLRFAEEKEVLEKASVWARLASEAEGLNNQQLAYNLNIYASLLEKSGNKREAKRVRKQIDEVELEKAKKEGPFQMLIPLE